MRVIIRHQNKGDKKMSELKERIEKASLKEELKRHLAAVLEKENDNILIACAINSALATCTH